MERKISKLLQEASKANGIVNQLIHLIKIHMLFHDVHETNSM